MCSPDLGDEGVADARRLLAAAAEIHLAARRRAIPLFEETSRAMYKNGNLDEETLRGTDHYRGSGDVSDVDTGFVWDAVPTADILAMQPGPVVYTDLLWGAVDGFVFEWTDAGAGSSRKGSR